MLFQGLRITFLSIMRIAFLETTFKAPEQSRSGFICLTEVQSCLEIQPRKMKTNVWGTIEVPDKIEFVSYSPEYYEQVLDVMRNSFFQYETVSVASGVNKNVEAQKDLEILCSDVLKRNSISLMARDVDKDKIVGISLNVIQVANN